MKRFLVVLAAVAVAVCMSGVMSAQEKVPTAPVVLKAMNGNVTFDHVKHGKIEGVKCEQCHHASKPEKAGKSAHEACGGCHTKPAAAPMKTGMMQAFHVAMAKSGICVDCHAKQKAAGKKVPGVCADCHKKA